MCYCYMYGCFYSYHLVVERSTAQRNFVKKKKVSNYGESKIKTAQGQWTQFKLLLFRRQLSEYALFRLRGASSCSLPLGQYLNSHKQSAKTGDSRQLAVWHNLKDMTGMFAPRYCPPYHPRPPHHEISATCLTFSAKVMSEDGLY